nr:hypothetical protein [Tanacetum cinerariifolium]
MEDPNITIEESIKIEEEKARRRGKVYNLETAMYGKSGDDNHGGDHPENSNTSPPVPPPTRKSLILFHPSNSPS